MNRPRQDSQAQVRDAAVELAANLARVRERISAAAHRAGRDPASVALIAVSKARPSNEVGWLAEVGQLDFGENRIEEAVPKIEALAARGSLRWHMIGHIQSRKARDVIRAGFSLVHSVDSRHLAEQLSRFAEESGRRQQVLLECNVSGEPNKAGFSAAEPERWQTLLPEFGRTVGLPGLDVLGLMTMAPQVEQPEEARPHFLRLAALRDFLRLQLPARPWTELSMGMTDDFEVAIEAGATLVRIGRAIFGKRPLSG